MPSRMSPTSPSPSVGELTPAQSGCNATQAHRTQLGPRRFRSRDRRRAADELAAGTSAAGIGHQFLDELLGIGSQEPLWIPYDVGPSADRRPAVNQRHGTYNAAGHLYVRGNNRNSVIGRGQRDECVGGG